MRIIARPRGRGKSEEAVRLANETGAQLIVPTRTEAMRLGKKTDRFPITFDEFLHDRMRGSDVRNVVIDNADMLLRLIVAGLTIEAITLNDDTDPDARLIPSLPPGAGMR